ncbi:hypothetical protein D9M72_632180 [compost metagenome]
MDSVAVDQAGTGGGEVAVPDAVCALWERQALLLALACAVEEAEFYFAGCWRCEGEVDALI